MCIPIIIQQSLFRKDIAQLKTLYHFVVIMNLRLVFLFCFEIDLKFNWDLLINCELISHYGFSLSFSDVDQHVSICIIVLKVLLQISCRVFKFLMACSHDFERAHFTSVALSKCEIFSHLIYLSIVKLEPSVIKVWPDEREVMAIVKSASVYKDWM